PAALPARQQARGGAVARVLWLGAVLAGHAGATYICQMTASRGQMGRLVVCPTPIGNLDDLTSRVLGVLREADVIACEDTRHTRRLLARYAITAPLVSLHEHNERARAGELVQRLRAGALGAL